MTKQEKLNPLPAPRPQAWPSAAWLAAALIGLLTASTAKAAPGDQWILDIDHADGSGYTVWGGAGYNGAPAYEFDNHGSPVGLVRVYWALNGLSVGTGNPFPNTTELYTIEWYVPILGGQTGYQPIESQFHGAGGETYPNDSSIPWAGEYGTDHEYIQAPFGTAGTWVSAGPGPHTPESSTYNCLGDNGMFMWVTSGSWLYVKWDFGGEIDRTWSALRLTQITPVTITSISRSGNTVNVTWMAILGKTYQLQSKTDLTQPTWNNVGGTVTATGNTATAPDTIGANTRHFYRVVLLP